MHEPDQLLAFLDRARALRPDGVLVLQYHSLGAILDDAQWNAVRLGHYAYYSTPAMIRMLARVGLRATSARRFPFYGGTVLMTASRDRAVDDASIATVRDQEADSGVLRADAVGRLQASVGRTADAMREMLELHKAQGRRVYGYSAASRAVALLCLAGVDTTLLDGVADASPSKQGRRMPGTDIPIVSPDDLVAAAPDIVLVFVPDLLPEVRAALPEIEAAGGRWEPVRSAR